MQKVFFSLKELDARCVANFAVPSELLMENAARGLGDYLKERLQDHRATVQIVCGSGDNGADGLALARMIADDCRLRVVMPKEARSALCIAQKQRLKALAIEIYSDIEAHCDYLIDAFLGTGFSGVLNEQAQEIINKMNRVSATKIACDIPSGLNAVGQVSPVAFVADITISMGALKCAFYSDTAKDLVGTIRLADLGIPRSKYQAATTVLLLQAGDFKAPKRTRQNSHKGLYGHAAVFCGEKEGACVLASTAAFAFGLGAVTVFGNQPQLPAELMYCAEGIPLKATAVCIGAGCGKAFVEGHLQNVVVRKLPLVLDAEALTSPLLPAIFEKLKCAVLTPHPKEFALLVKQCGLGSPTVAEIQADRFTWLQKFCTVYPNITLILKGANVLIGKGDRVFINALGKPALAKAGSGDVLAGLVTALLAQGYDALDAAIHASLAHALASCKAKTSYGLSPFDLVQFIKEGL